MKYLFLSLCLLLSWTLFAQRSQDTVQQSHFLSAEVLLGQLSNPNANFPNTQLQTSYFLQLGSYQTSNTQEWAERLGYPKTGWSLGFSDYGNPESVGQAYSLMPFAEFDALGNKRFRLLFGLGASYHNVQYDIKSNPNNKGISTQFAWAFRGALLYEVLKLKQSSLKLGLNYLHHSNGHVKLPNQGFNSFLIGLSYEMGYAWKENTTAIPPTIPRTTSRTYNYFAARLGVGQNVLSQIVNDKKEIFSAAFTYGKVINTTYKFGGGVYYRFYEHYHSYIKNQEELITERFPHFYDNPFGYATNFGIFGTGELLLNHVGIEFQLGLNIYKPFYQVDWILNKGYTYTAYDAGEEPYIVANHGELDWYYEIKRTVSSRLGLKYYLIGTRHTPKHNFYLGAHINANLGQADFNELSFGYLYSFNFKSKG